MYQPYETEISQSNLATVFSKLTDHVCLIGGWGVYLTVNDNFNQQHGRNYMGSKDIDLGFHIDKSWDENGLKGSVFAKSMTILEKDLKFTRLGFRYVKYYHTETRKELTEEEARTTQRHLMFDLNVDPIVDYIHPKIKEIFKFDPVDEPRLSLVFDDNRFRTLSEFGGNFMLPNPEVLLAAKINSVCRRDETHKRIKDIADIYALLWYSDVKFVQLKTELNKICGEKKVSGVISTFNDNDYAQVSSNLGIDKSEIKRVIDDVPSF